MGGKRKNKCGGGWEGGRPGMKEREGKRKEAGIRSRSSEAGEEGERSSIAELFL